MPTSYLPFEQRKCGWVPRGVGVFRSPFYHLQRQTYRGGFPINRKFRVEISTRPAYLFGLRLSGGNYFFPLLPPFLLFIARRLSRGFLFGISTRCISTLEPGNILPKNSTTSCTACTSFGTSNASGFLCSGQIPRTGQLSQSSLRTTSPGLSASLNPCQLSLRADASAKFSIASTATFANM